MATSVSPIGTTTTYVYDDINRVTSENASSTTATDITYSHDSCANGIARLCAVVVDAGATTSYAYDALGRVSEETKTIDGTAYTTTYTYDRRKCRLRSLSGTRVKCITAFNDAGQIDEVIFDDPTNMVSFTAASSIDYTPTGSIASIAYGNGVVSTYDYDASDLYRLSGVTTVSGGSTLEDYTYTYDAGDT